MKDALSTLDLALNKLSYEISQEFPFLTIIWIPHGPGQRRLGLKAKLPKIMDHPASSHILSDLESLSVMNNPHMRLSPITIAKTKSFFPKNAALACAFIEITDHDEVTLKQSALLDLFRVLHHLNLQNISPQKALKKKGSIIQTLTSVTEESILNLAADCFAGISLTFQGQKNAIARMAKFRAQKALDRHAGHKPELYPFPLILELVKLLLKTQSDKLQNKRSLESSVYKTSFAMANQILQGIDIEHLKSWEEFCQKSQILAWSNIEPKKILGTAVYTCEDAFIRSDAYLVSEILNIEPALVTNFDFYNPFADEEVNERRHRKLALEIFETAFSKATPATAKNVFEETARLQNEEFLTGRILGWAALGFLEIVQKISSEKPYETLKIAEEIFKEELIKIDWTTIRKAGEKLIEEKRKGRVITIDHIEEILSPTPEMKILINTLMKTKRPPDEERP